MTGLRRTIFVLIFTILSGLLLPSLVAADCGGDATSCKACHEGEQQKPVNAVGIWHTQHAFGDFCAGCHAGDTTIKEKDGAHAGMRPLLLSDPKTACSACHADNYEALAVTYQKSPPAPPAPSAPAFPTPGSRNGLFILLNAVTLLGVGALVWAFEKGPLKGKTLPKPTAPMQGAEPQPRNPMARRSWSPYWAGAGLGVVAVLALWLSRQPLGSSGAFLTIDSYLLKATGSSLADSVYFKMVMPAKVTWQLLLVGGVVLGALISALWSGDFRLEMAPDRWLQVFGQRKWLRWVSIFLGGMILEFGASIAGGCTSGLAIAGSLQLAGAGFLFIGGLFATGILTTRLLYGRKY